MPTKTRKVKTRELHDEANRRKLKRGDRTKAAGRRAPFKRRIGVNIR